MTRDQFIRRRRPDWRRFEILVAEAESKNRSPLMVVLLNLWRRLSQAAKPQSLSGNEIAELSALYRGLCFDLSLIQSRDWGTSMSRYLNDLAARGHNVLYSSPPGSMQAVVAFVLGEFPALVRANGRYFLLALILFVVPGAICGTVVARDPSLAGRVMPGMYQMMFDHMYEESVSERQQHMEGAMAGFYVRNNVGVAFRCFAMGAFAGIGTVITLVYNSIFLGTVTGYVIGRGHGANFLEFVIGHGSFELTAIVISGAAGLIIGHTLIHPGQRSRADAIRDRGLVAVKLVLGAGVMLCVAAILEAFWSPSLFPFNVKMIVGVMLWISVILYLGFAGRSRKRAGRIEEPTPLTREFAP